jgi:transposase
MRTKGSPAELEHRRVLAVQRVLEGHPPQEIADFLDVDVSSVRRWLMAFERGGLSALLARPSVGRPGKLTRTQEKIVRRWLADDPSEHGFATDLWSCARLAELIRQEWGVVFNPRYVSRWLQARGFSLQKPLRVPRERDPQAIAAWVQTQWPRIKKKHADGERG